MRGPAGSGVSFGLVAGGSGAGCGGSGRFREVGFVLGNSKKLRCGFRAGSGSQCRVPGWFRQVPQMLDLFFIATSTVHVRCAARRAHTHTLTHIHRHIALIQNEVALLARVAGLQLFSISSNQRL